MTEDIKLLIDNLVKWNEAYYNKLPLVTDLVYDSELARLKSIPNIKKILEDANALHLIKDVGTPITINEKTKKHLYKMYSLDNVYSLKELLQWLKSKNVTENMTTTFEPKVDGMSAEIYYKEGKLTLALTRGNKEYGIDITDKIKRSNCLPLYIDYKEDLVVNVELYIKISSLEKLNALRKIKDSTIFKNTRQGVAGLINTDNASEEELSFVDCVIHTLPELTQEPLSLINITSRLYSDNLENLRKYFTNTNRVDIFYEVIYSYATEEYGVKYKNCRSVRYPDIPMDGIVIKINDVNFAHDLGYTRRVPRWAVAWKFEAPEATTTITGFKLNVGRTGVLGVVASLSAVNIEGVNITQAIVSPIKRLTDINNKIGYGGVYRLYRAGNTIPIIGDTIVPPETSFNIPYNCPFCSSEIKEKGAHYYCSDPYCPSAVSARFLYLAKHKDQCGLKGIGPSFIDNLIKSEEIIYASHLYQHFISTSHSQYVLQHFSKTIKKSPIHWAGLADLFNWRDLDKIAKAEKFSNNGLDIVDLDFISKSLDEYRSKRLLELKELFEFIKGLRQNNLITYPICFIANESMEIY